MDPSLITVLILLAGIFLVIRVLVFIHDRDKRRDAKNNQ
jgi:hypothetical protein